MPNIIITLWKKSGNLIITLFFLCLVCVYLISMAKIILNFCPDCHQQKANPLLAQDTADLLFDSQLKSLLIFCQQQEANSLLHTWSHNISGVWFPWPQGLLCSTFYIKEARVVLPVMNLVSIGSLFAPQWTYQFPFPITTSNRTVSLQYMLRCLDKL